MDIAKKKTVKNADVTIVTTCIYEEMLKLNSKKYMWYLDKYFQHFLCYL